MSCRNALVKAPPRNFDANYLESRMREHREWQERETERLCAEACDELDDCQRKQVLRFAQDDKAT